MLLLFHLVIEHPLLLEPLDRLTLESCPLSYRNPMLKHALRLLRLQLFYPDVQIDLLVDDIVPQLLQLIQPVDLISGLVLLQLLCVLFILNLLTNIIFLRFLFHLVLHLFVVINKFL